MSGQYTRLPAAGSIIVSSPSIGTNGSPAPTSSDQIGAQDNSGNLQPLKVDGSDNLKVVLAASSINQAVNLTQVGGASFSLGQQLAAASLPIVLTAAQLTTLTPPTTVTVQQSTASNLLAQVSQPTAASLNATVVQSTGSNLHVNVDNFPATQPVSGTVTSNQGSAAALAGAWPVEITDGTNILGTSTHPIRIDPTGTTSQPVTQSTASALNATVVQGTASNLLAQVSQPTASSLNATVVQGTASNLLAQVSQPTASSLNATVVQGTAANLNATVSIAAAQTLATVTTVSAVTAITNALPAGTNSIGGTFVVGTAKANAPIYNDYSSVNVTTAAYVQLVASTSNACNAIEIFDSSGQGLIFAVGGLGSEVDQFFIFPGGNGRVNLSIPASSRISIKAKTATANSGFIMVNFYE